MKNKKKVMELEESFLKFHVVLKNKKSKMRPLPIFIFEQRNTPKMQSGDWKVALSYKIQLWNI